MKKVCYLLMAVCCSCAAHDPDTYTSRYYLDFAVDSARYARSAAYWARDNQGYDALFRSMSRTVPSSDGTECLTYCSVPCLGDDVQAQVLRLEWGQRLPLPPEAHSQPVEVALRCRGEGLRGVTVTAQLANDAEQVVASRQTTFVPTDDVAPYAVSLPAESDACALWLNLDVEGQGNTPSEIGLQRVEVRIGGKSLDSFSLPRLPEVNFRQAPGSLVQLWPSLAGKRVVGLGGSSAWNGREAVAVAAAIGQDVRQGHTRVVLVDRPAEQVFTLNRYVFGLTSDTIIHGAADAALRPLLDTLRACNQAVAVPRVRLAGIRLNINFGVEGCSTGTDLFDFLVAANAAVASPQADVLATVAYEEGPTAALAYWEAHPDALDGVLSEDERADVRHVLTQWQAQPADVYAQIGQSDSTTSVNVQYVVGRYAADPAARVVICGRSVGLNPVTGYPLTAHESLGARLRRGYADAYAAVAVTSEGGTVLVPGPTQTGWTSRQLAPAPVGSLEHAAAEVASGLAYFSREALPDTLVLMRAANGQTDHRAYFLANPYRRYAGVLFVGKEVPEPRRFVDPASMTAPDAFRANAQKRREALERIRQSEAYRAYKSSQS